MSKPRPRQALPLSDLIGAALADSFARQGFASAALVTRWAEIVGDEIAAHAEPLRIQWPRGPAHHGAPGTLVLRVEGPIALEVQHLSGVILERVNRFFGWQAVARLALRQAPLARRMRPMPPPAPDAAALAAAAAALPADMDESLRQALARLGAAITRP